MNPPPANRTDVSVIIVTRNTCALTRAAVQSVLDGDEPPAREILVVDNGSTDDTASVLPREFPQIQFVRMEKNLGFARACNLAAKRAGGEFLLLLNSDARLAPEALARALAWMRGRPDCAVAGAQLLNADGSRQNSIANFPSLATELLNKSLLRRLQPEKFPGKEQDFREPVAVETVVGAFMLIRKEVWDALGGLDERYFFFFEETDFCLRARRHGQHVFHLPEVHVWHGQGQTARQVSVDARIEYWRSRYAYFAKNYRLPTRLVLAAGLWLRLLFDSLAAGVCVLATLGQNARWRGRWQVCHALLRWHLRGRPKEGGLCPAGLDTNENILLVRLKSIGDILFTLPAVHAVRENFPDAKLYFLVSKENAPLLRGFPEVDGVIPLDRAVYFSKNLPAMCRSTFELLRRLRKPKFSRAIDFQGYGETEFFTWWTGAPERWGCVYHPPRGRTYTRGVRRNDRLHLVDWNLSLLQQCGLRIGAIRNEFVLPDDALDEAGRFFAAHHLDAARPTLFIQPFTSSPQKNWPLENYLALAADCRAGGRQVLFGGGPSECARLEPARAAGFPVAAGTPLLVTAGLMKLSTVTVGADTGLLHIAVAMGRRVVMLMRFNPPGNTYPFRHADWTVTPPAGKSIVEIPTAAVVEACARAFSEQAGNAFC